MEQKALIETSSVAIFLNGERRDPERALSELRDDCFLICADGCIDLLLALNRLPHLVVGDFDTLDTEQLEKLKEAGVETRAFPRDKDRTDFEIALDIVEERSFEELFVFFPFGKSPDHALMNLFALRRFSGQAPRVLLEDGVWSGELLFGPVKRELSPERGEGLSLIPLSDVVEVTFLRGTKWELKGEVLRMHEARAIRNQILNDSVCIEIKEGTLLVLQERFCRGS